MYLLLFGHLLYDVMGGPPKNYPRFEKRRLLEYTRIHNSRQIVWSGTRNQFSYSIKRKKGGGPTHNNAVSLKE